MTEPFTTDTRVWSDPDQAYQVEPRWWEVILAAVIAAAVVAVLGWFAIYEPDLMRAAMALGTQ